jgi:transposase
MEAIYYGIDFHKNTSTISALRQDGKEFEPIRTVLSDKLISYFSNKPLGKIAIEATGGSNEKAKALRALGHEVFLVETNQFKAIGVNGKKTDDRDAKALSQALRLNALPRVHLKSDYSRQLKSLVVMRDHLVEMRTSQINHIRGILREYGHVMPTGVENFWKNAPRLISKIELSSMRWSLEQSFEQCRMFKEQELALEKELILFTKEDPRVELLKSVKGVGNLVAYALIATSDDIHRFPSAKEFASYLGLTPRVESSGGKTFMGSISKSGSELTRRYLIHGARAWLASKDFGDSNWEWAEKLKKRQGQNKAVVALAHRMSRICYALLRDQSLYMKNYEETHKRLKSA